ncbi:hypothetical protein AB0J21_33465 [Streptomyces sp. NPDC049954]|uniref:hypothetical protein n=1 Tax=Streptomyces sp. NPDC049954 TaxID=3155779 RepID=UPI00344949F9
MNDVILRTAATLGTAVLAAVLSWTAAPVDPASADASYGSPRPRPRPTSRS